jgi:hypothetical protein
MITWLLLIQLSRDQGILWLLSSRFQTTSPLKRLLGTAHGRCTEHVDILLDLELRVGLQILSGPNHHHGGPLLRSLIGGDAHIKFKVLHLNLQD